MIFSIFLWSFLICFVSGRSSEAQKKSSSVSALEHLFTPQRMLEDSVDAATMRQRKNFENHLRKFFVETNSRRHALKNYSTFKEDSQVKTTWIAHPWSVNRYVGSQGNSLHKRLH